MFYKFSLSALALLVLTSCNQQFYQIATLSSEQVTMNDNGHFMDTHGDFCISYDFWSENGQVCFTIFNNSDKDIYLDLSQSYFIDNLQAHDYFKERTIITNTSSALASNSGSYLKSKAVVSIGTQIETHEKKIVAIPAHAYKTFTEFKAGENQYRSCGFVLNPRPKENAVLFFDATNSPSVIENRLMLLIDQKETPIVHKFHIKEYRNMRQQDALVESQSTSCDGNKNTVKTNKYKANNRYFIQYALSYENGVLVTDRIK